MAKLLKLRRGTTTQHGSFTGAEGEVTVDTDKDSLVVHDGSTAGGFPIARSPATAGTVGTSEVVQVDANKDASGFRNITATGELDAATLDISGDADIDGTLEADAITVDGTALNEYISDTVGAMVGSNTETGIAVTYEDSDNTLDFSITSIPGVTFTGDVIFDNATHTDADLTWDESDKALEFNDNVKAVFGTASDGLEVYHDASNSYIADTGTGELFISGNQVNIKSAAGEYMAYFNDDAEVALYYDDVKTFATIANGIVVTGTEAAASYIYLHADEGDDNADKWNINADTGGDFKVQSYSGGSWQDELVLTNAGNLTATGNVTAYSDARLKTDVDTIENALDKVTKLRGVSFTKVDTHESGIGVIALEIEEVIPEVVQDGAFKSVAYGNIVGVLIEAIKELKTELDELKGGS